MISRVKRFIYRKWGIRKSLLGAPILDDELANHLVSSAIAHCDRGCLVSRLGTTEAEVLRAYFQLGFSGINNVLLENLKNLSGVFPISRDHVERFVRIYQDALAHVDILGVRSNRNEYPFWDLEKSVIRQYGLQHRSTLINLELLSPLSSWVNVIRGKRILVIHPFKNSIAHQIEKLGLVFDSDYMCDCEFSIIRAPQSLGGVSLDGDKSWYDGYLRVVNFIEKSDFDLALIGAGAYGLPFGAVCKNMGKTVIHAGGATQLFFGINGKRWIGSKQFESVLNKNWIYPQSDDGEPVNKDRVENGCYWGPER